MTDSRARLIFLNSFAPAICLAASRETTLPYTVIWYDKAGIVAKTLFDTEKAARDHAAAMFPDRRKDEGIVAVEVRKDSGDVVFSMQKIAKACA